MQVCAGFARVPIIVASPDTPPGWFRAAQCSAIDGRSPDLRVVACPILPELALSGDLRGHSPLTVAGAVTDLARFGSSSPYSLFIPHAFSAHENHRGQSLRFR